MNLREMFPMGEFNEGRTYFNIKDGAYWWPVAEIVDGVPVLTQLGLQLSGQAALDVADTSTGVIKLTKKRGKKPAQPVVDDFDLGDI